MTNLRYPEVPDISIGLGDLVRSYDFIDHNENYVEGHVAAIGMVPGVSHEVYTIKVNKAVVDGKEAEITRKFVYPPVNGTKGWLRPTCGVQLITRFGNLGENLERMIKDRAEFLTKRGYRRVSNKHLIVARVDVEDVALALAIKMKASPARFHLINEDGTLGPVAPQWEDHYRRVYSDDSFIVPDTVYKLIPGS